MMRTLFNKEKIDGSYVYALLDPSTDPFILGNFTLPHRPFYVGKGKEYRAWHHEKEKITESCNKHKIYKIMKIKEDFDGIPIAILEECLTDDESLCLEEYYAELIGYDNLTNINPCGVRNPILHGELNGFYGKTHTPETIEKIVKRFKSWYHGLSGEEKLNWAETRRTSGRSLFDGGYTRPKSAVEQGLRTRFGDDFRENAKFREIEKENKRLERKALVEAKKIEKLSRGWAHLDEAAKAEYWKNNRAGENNGMFGKGDLVTNENNGRAKKYVVTVGQDVFLIHGRLKHFQKAFKKFYKCSDPLRSDGFIEKYGVTVKEVGNFNIDGILFVDENSFSGLNRSYTKCKKPNSSK